jgi:4-amino-4-deoxy-L-arabinose transferase-like glycosyltransferase
VEKEIPRTTWSGAEDRIGLLPPVRSFGVRWWFVALLVGYLTCTLLVPRLGGTPDDETAYFQYAERLTHGDYADASQAGSYLWRGPGLPLLLAPFVAVDAPLQIPRLIPPLLLFGAVVLFYRLLCLRLSERASLVGALALGLYYPFLRSLGFVYTEPAAIFLVVLALYFWTRRSIGGGTWTVVGAGLALGALALTRLEYGYVLTACLLIATVVWLKGRGRPARDATALCAVGLALCVPWLAYTYSLTDKPFYWSNAGSLSLYWMTSPDPDDLGDPHADVFGNPNLESHVPLFRRLRAMHPIQADEELRRTARQQLDEHPERFARNLLNNLSRLLFNFPFSFKQQTATPLFYLVPNALLLTALGVAGFVLARSRRWWGFVVPPAIFGALGFAIHVPVAGYPRYWFPVVPIAVFVAVLGISALAARGIQPRPRVVEPVVTVTSGS